MRSPFSLATRATNPDPCIIRKYEFSTKTCQQFDPMCMFTKKANDVQEIKWPKTRICGLGGRALLSEPKIEPWIRACVVKISPSRQTEYQWNVRIHCRDTKHRTHEKPALLSLPLLQTWICNALDRVTEVCTYLVTQIRYCYWLFLARAFSTTRIGFRPLTGSPKTMCRIIEIHQVERGW